MLGTIYYETSSEQASMPSIAEPSTLSNVKRFAQIMVAPILPQFLREGLAKYRDHVVHL